MLILKILKKKECIEDIETQKIDVQTGKCE